MTERNVLDSWKEIAAYLGRTGKTCRNWEKEYGLPVHRLDGSPRAHVFAYADEVDRWKEELLREKPAASREITVKFSLKRLLVAAVFGLLALAAALGVFFKSRGPHYDPERIIVATFENQTGDKSLQPLGRIASDWITQGVSKAGVAELVETPPGELAPGTPQEAERIRVLAREAGAGTLVSGAYFLQGKSLSFHARVSDMSNGKVIKALDPVSGPAEEPMKAIEFLKQKVMGALAEKSDLRVWPLLDYSGAPPTYEAYKEYAAGRDAHFRGDFARAIEFCLRAAELDPSFKTPLLQAAIAYSNLGQYAAGEKLIVEVDKAGVALSPYDQLLLNRLKAFYQGDLTGQLWASRQSASRLKGMSIYQWGLDAVNNDHPREAVKALSMLDPEGIWMKDWPQYWSILTNAYHMLGRYRLELKQARRGRRQFPEVIWLLLHEVRALAALGRIEEIDGLIDQSLNMKSDKWPAGRNITAREIYNPGWLMIKAGQELRVHGFPKGSFRMFDRAVRWLQARPDEEKAMKNCREQLAHAYYGVGRWLEARILVEGLLKEDPENVNYLRMCGVLAVRRGDREEALRISKQLEEIKRPYLWGRPTYHRACIASLLGEKEAAVRLLQEAVFQGREYRYLYEDMDLDPLRDYPPFKELIRPKG
jgi:tetratricopeptide (TPR) repeat protein